MGVPVETTDAEGGEPAPSADGGGDFEAALAGAIAAGDAAGDEPDAEADVNAPTDPPAGDEPAAEPPKAAKPKDDEPETPQKLREAIEAETKAKLRGEFSALARDRAKLREREATAVATEQRAKGFEQKAQSFDALVARLVAGDATVFYQLGGDGDAILNKLLDGIVATEKSPAEREVQKMRAELASRDAAAETAKQQAMVDSWKASIRAEVTAQAETFDLVNSLDQHEAVIATIEAYYAKYPGVVLPVADAAKAVEDQLAKGLERSKKFGARAPGTNAQPSKGNPAPSAPKRGSLTLSSVASGEVPASGGDDLPLDDPRKRFDALMAQLA